MPKNKNYRKNGRMLIILFVVAALLGTALYATALENQVTNLSVTANPMRIGTTNYISFTLGLDSKVSINIYKDTGEHVRTVWTGLSKVAGNYLQGWDGKDKNNVLVTDGYYKIVVEAVDTAGAQVGLAEMTIKVAKAPAITAVTDTPDPFNPLIGENSTISYTLSNDSAVTITIIKNFATVRTLALNELKLAGANVATWDGKDNLGNVVSDGPVTYQIDAASAFEPTFKAQFKGTAAVEKENPRITDFGLMPNPLKISSNSLSISYTLSEDAKVNLAIIDSTGATVRNILSAVAKKAGYNSSAWDGKDSLGAYVPEGTYSAVISAVDNFNKSSGDVTTTFKAGYQPAISLVSFTPSVFNPEDPATPTTTISYNISKDALVTVEIFNGYTKVKTLALNASQTAGTQTLAWDGRDDAGAIVGDADYTVQITATSAVVNTFTSTYKGTLTVEKGAPRVTGVTLSPNPYKLGTTGNLSIMYNLSENASVNINVYRGETLVRQVAVNQSKNAGFNSVTWNGKDDAGNNVPEGIYTVTIQGVDKAGNTGQAQGTVTCGYLPALSAVSHTPNVFNPPVDVNAAVYFSLSNDANVTLRIMNGITPVRTINVFPMSAGNQYLLWDGKDDSGKYVFDGPYTYKIDAVSPTVSTFSSTYEGTITVETSAPTLSNLGVSPLTVKIGSNSNFSYQVSEPGTITAQILKSPERTLVRDLPVQVKTAGGYYTIPWDTRDNLGSLITTGTYILKLTVVDNFNNSSSAEYTFQAGAVPVIASAAANPATIDLSTGGGSTVISYNVSEPSYITAKIINSAGKVVKNLLSFVQVSVGNNSVTWDGKDSTGSIVNDNYTFTIDATSTVGYFKATQASGTISIIGTVPVPPPSCTDCHTTYPASHPMANCAGCHSNNQPIGSIHSGTENCASCHATHGTTQILTYECTFCHNENYSYKIPFHPGDMNVLHTAPLAQDCSQCHDAKLNVEHPLHKNAQGVAYDCNTCHQSTVAEVVYAIANSQKNCDACHGPIDHNAVHTNTSFTTLPKDVDMNCALCHNSVISQEHMARKDASGANYTCNTCHGSTRTEVINAITNNNLNCEACHINTATSQPTFHTSSGTPLHDSTYMLTPEVNCQQCHANNLKNEHVGRVNSITGIVMDCATCHSSSNPLVVMAITGKNTRCDACHTMPPATHNPGHTATVFTSDATRTDQATCSLCHVKVLPDQHVNKVTTAGVTMNCNTCHSSAASATVISAVYNKNDNCEACHTVHPVQSALAQHDSIDVYAVNADVNCASCHNRNVRAEHMDNPARTTMTGQPITCDTCHASTSSIVQLAISTGNKKCDACHTYPNTKHQPAHTTNVYTTDTTRTDDCSLCHVKSLTDQHVGRVNSTTGQAMDCNTCHTSANANVVNAIATGQTNSCEACHTLHPVKDVTQLHDSVNFTNNTYDPNMNCSTCHNSSVSAEHVNKTTEAGVTMNCNTCHKSTRTDVQQAIANNNLKCEACHTKVHTSTNPYHATTFVANPTMDCARCHNANSIADDHAQYKTSTGAAITCATCHNSTDTAVVNAIRTSNTGCDACHTSRHTDVQGPHKTTFIPDNTWNCSNCHAATAIGYNLTGSYHKIPGVTPTTSLLHGSTFVSPWTATSDMTCRDCHNKNTSTNTYYGKLLKGAYTTTTGKQGYSTANQLCFFCHSTSAYGPGSSTFATSGFNGDGGKNWHAIGNHTERGGCMSCHSMQPHSSTTKHLVVTRSTAEPNSQLSGYTHATSYSKSNCTTSCH